MNDKIAKIKDSNFIKTLKSILTSKYFPFITAVLSLLCYYLGWDIVFIYYVGIVGLLILLLLDDISPLITVLLFMCVLVSYKNSPSNIMSESDYYFRPEILAQVFVVIGALGAAVIYRLVLTCIKRNFSFHPVFWGLCGFALVLFLNGLFSANYNPKNLVYGLVMALCFLGIFVALKDNLVMNDEAFERIALSFFALSIVLIVELLVAYFTVEGLYVDGVFHRERLTFGWGMWNTMGMMLLICLPASLYLAGRYKYGFVFTLFSAILFVAVWMSCSRQAMLGSLIIYPVSIIILLVKGTNRFANICVVLCALVAISIVLLISRDTIFKYFKDLISQIVVDGDLYGSGRVRLWKGGIEYFKSAPFLGVGFYSNLYEDFQDGFAGFSGMSFIPHMCHNTIIQLLSSCGIMGLLTYAVHRVQTVISFFKNVNYERIFIVLTIVTLVGISLVDNHLFNIFPTIIYSCLIATLIASERKDIKN